MAWLGLDRLLLGTDLTAEQARSNQLDQQSAAVDQQLVDQGYWTQSQADQAATDQAQADAAAGTDNVVGAVDTAFQQGAVQGLQNVLALPGQAVGAVGSGASSVLGGILKNIPWWVYVGFVGFIFLWMGGLELLRGSLARR
ncbi:MAG TPA: hypothetical protein VG167_15005 [Verrucomicrobiae bacterium]|nr:hypothetical protein [Verrucomicrobiae bacterium]